MVRLACSKPFPEGLGGLSQSSQHVEEQDEKRRGSVSKGWEILPCSKPAPDFIEKENVGNLEQPRLQLRALQEKQREPPPFPPAQKEVLASEAELGIGLKKPQWTDLKE